MHLSRMHWLSYNLKNFFLTVAKISKTIIFQQRESGEQLNILKNLINKYIRLTKYGFLKVL